MIWRKLNCQILVIDIVINTSSQKLMGNINKLCEDNENKLNGFDNPCQSTLALNKQPLLIPERIKIVQNLYRFLTNQKSLQFSIDSNKQVYNPLRFSIFGEQGIYVGQTKNYKPHGSGQVYFDNGNYLEAVFEEGQIESQDALFIEQNGNHYRGGFKESAQTGIGLMRASGQSYRGRFSRGRLEGKGSVEFEDGRKYVGNFRKGKIQGKGKLTQKNGETYEGYFRHGRKNGIGYMKTSKYQYVGPFENDMKEGKGSVFWVNGQKYEGWFQKDEICGYGQRHFKNGMIEKKVYKSISISDFFN